MSTEGELCFCMAGGSLSSVVERNSFNTLESLSDDAARTFFDRCEIIKRLVDEARNRNPSRPEMNQKS